MIRKSGLKASLGDSWVGTLQSGYRATNVASAL